MTEPERPHGPAQGEPTPASDSPAKPKGWIENLAERSTGLPGTERPAQAAGSEDTSLWKWAGIGLQFGASVIIFLLIGRWIDHHFGWNFAATLTLLALALIGNFYLLIKDAMRMDK